MYDLCSFLIILVFTSTAEQRFLLFTNNINQYFSVFFIVPFLASAAFFYVVIGISLGYPWCSRLAKYFNGMITRFASHYLFPSTFGNGTIFPDVKHSRTNMKN